MAIHISRSRPGCIAFMIDRSDSMGRKSDRSDQTLAQIATDIVNRTIFELVIRSTKTIGVVNHYFDVGVIGYGATSSGVEGVESAIDSTPTRRYFVSVPELAENPIGLEEQPSRIGEGTPDRFPIWVEPIWGYRSPMCEAFEAVGIGLHEWVGNAGADANPPVVINITDDGLATDAPYKGASLDDWQTRVRNISTSSGSVNIFTILVEPRGERFTLRPTSPDDLIRPGWTINEVEDVLRGRVEIGTRTWSVRDSIRGAPGED